MSSGESSLLSAAVSATQPVSRVPKPVVTIDDSAAPEARWYFEAGKRALEVWYPKIAQLIAYPDYLPLSTLKILAMNCSGGGWADGDRVLKICGKGAPDSPPPNIDTGLFVHEATHILQDYHPGALFALAEGIASWAGDLSQGIVRPASLFTPGLTYLNGYEYSGAFYGWVDKAHPSFIRNMNLRAHNAEFQFAWLQEETGETVEQLWRGMTGVELSPPGSLIANTKQCIRTPDLLQAPNTPLVLTPCGETDADKQVVYQPDLKRIHVNAHCMGVDGSWVMYQASNDPRVPEWQYENGSWVNQATHRCLQPLGGPTPYKDRLITAVCNSDSDAQHWSSLVP
jgi:hypothetical protein